MAHFFKNPIKELREEQERKKEEKRQKKIRQQKQAMRWCVIGLIVFFVIGGIGLFFEKLESDKQERELAALTDKVETEILHGDLDLAQMDVIKIQYTSSYSDEKKEKWDNTREGLIAIIEEKKQPKVELFSGSFGAENEQATVGALPLENIENTPVEEESVEQDNDVQDADEQPEEQETPDILLISDVHATLKPQYSHDRYADIVLLGNKEGAYLTLEIDKVGLEDEPVAVLWDENILNVEKGSQFEKNGKTIISYYVTGKNAGADELFFVSKEEYAYYGEEAGVKSIKVRKLDSDKGRVVYVTDTGSKYHLSEACAGPGAIKTTYQDVVGYEYGACGKCAQ